MSNNGFKNENGHKFTSFISRILAWAKSNMQPVTWLLKCIIDPLIETILFLPTLCCIKLQGKLIRQQIEKCY